MKDSKLKRKLIKLYEIFYEKRRLFVLRTKYHLRIMSSDCTISYIEKHHCSIARFGDGEFDLITDARDLGFQSGSKEISIRLREVLANHNKNLLICVPHCLDSIKECNTHSATFWMEWGKKDNHHQRIVNMIRSLTGRKYLFGDSQITRPYIDWKTSDRAKRTFPKLRHLWQDKDIIIVEGEQTRLGIGNDLFDNSKSIQRILAPAVGAFERYDEIKKEILKYYHGELIIMALGPTATILADDLSDMGIQALDIGNIDIEYEWFLRGAKERVAIPGKFTNEVQDGRTYSDCQDERYLCQIVSHIGC